MKEGKEFKAKLQAISKLYILLIITDRYRAEM